MQNLHWKCLVTSLALLNKLNMKFDSISNDIYVKNFYHQKFCRTSKNLKVSFCNSEITFIVKF